MTYHNVLTAARELPLADQVALAQALLGNIKTVMHADTSSSQMALSPLDDMNREELLALADAVVAPERQTKIRSLLEANRERTLSPDEEAAMDSYLDEIDQVALLKARALYTLKLQQPASTNS